MQPSEIKALPYIIFTSEADGRFCASRLTSSHPFSVRPETITPSTLDTHCWPSRAGCGPGLDIPSTFLRSCLLFLAAALTQLPARLEEAKQQDWRVRRRHQRQPDGPEVSPTSSDAPAAIMAPLTHAAAPTRGGRMEMHRRTKTWGKWARFFFSITQVILSHPSCQAPENISFFFFRSYLTSQDSSIGFIFVGRKQEAAAARPPSLPAAEEPERGCCMCSWQQGCDTCRAPSFAPMGIVDNLKFDSEQLSVYPSVGQHRPFQACITIFTLCPIAYERKPPKKLLRRM